MGNNLIESLESRRLLADTAIVRGFVFRDANHDGIRQSTEAGQANVRVYLDYNNNGARDGDAEPIVLTNSLGQFRFETAKAPATIPVRLLLTGTSFLQSRPANNAARTVTTVVGGNHEVESFGVYEKTPEPPPAVTVLTGIVYTDLDRDGTRDTNENGRPNVTVYIDTNNDGQRQDGEPKALTNAEGRYRFENVTAGDKTLRLLLTGTNLEQTQPAGGAGVHASVVANATTQAAPFGVAEKRVTPPPAVTVLTGIVYTDLDRDGTRDTNENGRPNVTVYIDTNNDGQRQDGEPKALTNAEGRYRFENVTAGDKTLRLLLTGTNLEQTQPAGGAGVHASVVANATTQAAPFGVAEKRVTPPTVTTATIRGSVFHDKDGDGVREDGEFGFPNLKVYLDLNNDGVRTDGEPQVLTNGIGRYEFTNVQPRADLHVRLNLVGTNLVQTLPLSNAARVLNVVAGGTYVDQIFGVREKPIV